MPTTHLSNLVSSKPKKLEEIAFSETVEVSTRHYADWKYGKETRLIPWEHLLAVGTKAIRGNQHLVLVWDLCVAPDRIAKRFVA